MTIINPWSSTQSVIALSSREAGYYGLVEGASVGIGVQSMLRDFGVEVPVVLHIDSSAAKGIGNRRGLGRLRHIELSEPRVQYRVASGRTTRKVRGTDNFSKALTKHSNRDRIDQRMSCTCQVFKSGRHIAMPLR